jgi:hypothetical protein
VLLLPLLQQQQQLLLHPRALFCQQPDSVAMLVLQQLRDSRQE